MVLFAVVHLDWPGWRRMMALSGVRKTERIGPQIVVDVSFNQDIATWMQRGLEPYLNRIEDESRQRPLVAVALGVGILVGMAVRTSSR
jgi:hypothetical protein